MQGPKGVMLFYSSCFAGWILSTVVATALLLLGISGDTGSWGLCWPGGRSCAASLGCSPAQPMAQVTISDSPGPPILVPVTRQCCQPPAPAGSARAAGHGAGDVLVPPACPAPQETHLAVRSAPPPWGIPSCSSPCQHLTCTPWVIWISGPKGKHNLISKLLFPLSELWGIPGMHKGPRDGCDWTAENATGEGGFAVKWVRIEGNRRSAWSAQVSGLKRGVWHGHSCSGTACLPQLSGDGQNS